MVVQDSSINDRTDEFVRVSERDPRYFELTDGSPFVPTGPNISFPRFANTEDEWEETMGGYLAALEEQGGNFFRVWLSHPYYEVEHERSGSYEESKAARIGRLLELAREHGLRVKPCFDHFRNLEDSDPPFESSVSFGKSLHHVDNGGTAKSMKDFFTGEASRRQFEAKIEWFGERYGDDPTVFAWELWNEINSVWGDGWRDWSAAMLAKLDETFPRNMTVQSLGSFCTNGDLDNYSWLCSLANNDFDQAHRYLDPGADWDICQAPMDVLAADAVRELHWRGIERPVLLSEVGAVLANHAGPSDLYEIDTEGVLLHDALFAPFFAGAAGPGQHWHWHHYIDEHDLWHHFGRFREAISNVDPPAENFQPREYHHPEVRAYILHGEETTLGWCRDKTSTWESELEEELSPEQLDIEIGLESIGVDSEEIDALSAYQPWADEWTDLDVSETATPPTFERSLILRLEHSTE